MKKNLLLLLPLSALLFACGEVPTPEASSSSSDEPNISSSEDIEEDSSTSVYVDPDASSKKAEVRAWLSSLATYEGNVISTSLEGEVVTYYMTGTSGEYFGMQTNTTATQKRYGKSSVGAIVVETGSTSINEGDSISYQKQIYHDKTLYYALTSYEDGTKAKETGSYKIGLENSYLNLSFYQNQVRTLTEFLGLIGHPGIQTKYSLPTLSAVGEYEISYSATELDGSTPVVRIGYDIKFHMVNGFVDSSLINISNETYLGSQIGQATYSSVSSTYDQGDYDSAEYEGEILNPSDFAN